MRRRRFTVQLVILALISLSSSGHTFGAAPIESRMSPSEALRTLMEGDQHFTAEHLTNPHRDAQRRRAVAGGQNPFVAVLSCSDSRVPPEIIFDEGLGDMFVVRVAGNTLDQLGLQSLAYAVEHLGTNLILVLGHDNCGAVTAAVKNYPDRHVGMMLTNIYPAVAATRNEPGDPISNAIDRNIELVVAQLKAASIFTKRLREGSLAVVGGRYNLMTGKVTILRH